MPSHRDRVKVSGDVHPPELEEVRGGTPLARDLEDEARPGDGENQAGFLKDKEAPSGGGSERR